MSWIPGFVLTADCICIFAVLWMTVAGIVLHIYSLGSERKRSEKPIPTQTVSDTGSVNSTNVLIQLSSELDTFRAKIHQDQHHRQGLFSSNRPSLRFFVLGIDARHLSNIAGLLFGIETIVSVAPFAIYPDTLFTGLDGLCFWTQAMGAVCYALNHSAVDIFYKIRTWALLGNSNVTSFMNEGTVKCFKYFIIVTAVANSLKMLTGPWGATTINASVYEGGVCNWELTPASALFIFINMGLTVISNILNIFAYFYILRRINSHLNIAASNQAARLFSLKAKRIAISTIVAASTTLLSMLLIAFTGPTVDGASMATLFVSLDVLCNAVAITLSYDFYKLLLNPFGAISNDYKLKSADEANNDVENEIANLPQ